MSNDSSHSMLSTKDSICSYLVVCKVILRLGAISHVMLKESRTNFRPVLLDYGVYSLFKKSLALATFLNGTNNGSCLSLSTCFRYSKIGDLSGKPPLDLRGMSYYNYGTDLG